MRKGRPVETVAEEILEAVIATPKRQRRMLSKSFWHTFGFDVRSKERIEHIKRALQERGLSVRISSKEQGKEFGSESKHDWVVLTSLGDPASPVAPADLYVAQSYLPANDWFALMSSRSFESEREVEYNFVMPLVEKLGYVEADQSIGHSLITHQGSKKIKTEADIVLFDGGDRAPAKALVVVEAKSPKKKLTNDAIGQARSYAFVLTTPLYVVTNGEEVRVWRFAGGFASDVQLLDFRRSELKERWSELFAVLNKDVARAQKVRNLAAWEQTHSHFDTIAPL